MKSHAKKANKTTPWSQWEWDAADNRYYRTRLRHGMVETESGPVLIGFNNVPRADTAEAAVQAATQQLSGLQLGSPGNSSAGYDESTLSSSYEASGGSGYIPSSAPYEASSGSGYTPDTQEVAFLEATSKEAHVVLPPAPSKKGKGKEVDRATPPALVGPHEKGKGKAGNKQGAHPVGLDPFHQKRSSIQDETEEQEAVADQMPEDAADHLMPDAPLFPHADTGDEQQGGVVDQAELEAAAQLGIQDPHEEIQYELDPDAAAPFAAETFPASSSVPKRRVHWPGGSPVTDETDDVLFMQAVMNQSREQYHGTIPGKVGESSATATSMVAPPMTPTINATTEDDDEEAGPIAQVIPPKKSDHIAGTEGEYEPLDPRYRVFPSHSFQPGWVFKVLWCEPEGSRVNTRSVTNAESLRDNKGRIITDVYGQKYYTGFRRFIIVAQDAGHCQCVPILTYGTQACKKKGIKPNRHGIVYQYGRKPQMLEREPRLGFNPVKMVIDAAGEKLAKESRVNYSKSMTVEHNVKVFFIGYIDQEDFVDTVLPAVETCKSLQSTTHPGPPRSSKEKSGKR